MYLPTLKENKQSRIVTSEFGGYDRRLRIGDGQWREMQNMTGDCYPMLASRTPRGIGEEIASPAGLTAKDALIWVSGSKIVIGGKAVELGLSEGVKQLVSMGAYLVIWPDRKYINTADTTDCGSIDAAFAAGESAQVQLAMCDAEGALYENVAQTEPADPAGGTLWVDGKVLKRWDGTSSMWISVPTVYTKISCTDIGKSFSEGDGVTLAGIAYTGDSETVKAEYAALNASKVIQKKGDNWIVVVGLVSRNAAQTGGLTVKREAPEMDYICQAQNRLWGCRYGVKDGKAVNEVYGCKLGDFKNWTCYAGLSTDSWAAQVGSDGAWTGAVNYQGYPTFFKETVLHRISVSGAGAHRVTDTPCRGVQKGSWRSLCVVNEVLYYKGRTEICAYDGSVPVAVSAELGDERYSEAVAGGYGRKYYISMKNSSGAYELLVYDAARGLWHKEDNAQALMFAAADDDLFYIDAATNRLVAVNGTQGTREGDVEWSVVSGIMGYEYPDHKYLSRFDLRLQMRGEANLYLQYDSSGQWHYAGRLLWKKGTTRSFAMPVIPRRCDHVQLKLSGKGEMRLFSIARILELGSDM